MTDTEPLPPVNDAPAPLPNAWDAQFARLRERFRGTKDSILFCVNAIQTGADADLDALKAQAEMHGLRITAASVNAARRLLLGGDARPARKPAPRPMQPRHARQAEGRTQPRAAGAPSPEVESLIRALVARVQQESDAKMAAMRAAIEEALTIIDDVLQ